MWSLCSGVAKALGAEAVPLAREYGDKAIGRLKQAVDAGFNDVGRLKLDKDLDALRERPDFQALLAKCEQLAKPKP